MDLNITVNDSNASIPSIDETQTPAVIPPIVVQFWTILLLEIPSLACTLFLLYHLLRSRRLRQGMHNHVIIILLLLTLGIEIFDNPLYIDAHRFGDTQNSFSLRPSICLMWWFFDYGAYGAITVFLAWGSFSRHILGLPSAATSRNSSATPLLPLPTVDYLDPLLDGILHRCSDLPTLREHVRFRVVRLWPIAMLRWRLVPESVGLFVQWHRLHTDRDRM